MVNVVYPTAPSDEVVGITDVDSSVLEENETEDEVLVRTVSELLVAESVWLVRRDSVEEDTKDEDVESVLLLDDSLLEADEDVSEEVDADADDVSVDVERDKDELEDVVADSDASITCHKTRTSSCPKLQTSLS